MEGKASWSSGLGPGCFSALSFRFSQHVRYGVECVDDMLDPVVCSDKDLVDEIGMTPEDVRRFHAPPPKHHEKLPEQKLDTSHLSEERLAHIERQTSDQDTHEGYSELCLFIRKLKKGMHFLRCVGALRHNATD